jgi:hypothetical protein
MLFEMRIIDVFSKYGNNFKSGELLVLSVSICLGDWNSVDSWETEYQLTTLLVTSKPYPN